MNQVIFILLMLLSHSNLYSQSYNRYGNGDTSKIYTIKRYQSRIDSLTSRIVEIKLVPDSMEAQITCKMYGNKIETINWFKNSRSMLKIAFYLKDGALVFISVREQSPLYNDLYKFAGFYFENDTIFYRDYYSTRRPCMAIAIDKPDSAIYGYNPAFTGEYLITYVNELFTRIKTAANIQGFRIAATVHL